jgi:subfamily B ATP-binding cassette protein MsbA
LLQQSLTNDLVQLGGNLVMLIGGVTEAILIDWRLSVTVIGLLACVIGFFVLFGRRMRRLSRQTLDALSDAMGAVTETLANIRLVKAFGREAYEDRRVGVKMLRVFDLSMRASRIEGLFSTVGFSSFMLVLLGVVWYGGRNVLAGTLSAGSLAGFVMAVFIISGPMGGLAMQVSRLQRAVGAAEKLFQILDDAPERPDAPDAVAFPAGSGHVTYEEIDFAYTCELPVLCGLSLDIPPGKVTAVVGPSGAGKTTLAALLYRFYEPQGGCIRIDGVPIDTIRRQDLRDQIGIVPQEPALFNGTLRENIRYGRLTATDAEVEAAACAANVAEFVAQFPQGYDTPIGERGVTLSGGQRQRVAIARAVLKDPRILILDEATSALDTRSEALVREALERLMQGRTTIVIAHRLTTIRDADQIVVLEGGKIAESGTHDDLMLLNGRYASLHNQNREEGRGKREE